MTDLSADLPPLQQTSQRAGPGRDNLKVALVRTIIIAAFLALWEILSYALDVHFYVSSPYDVFWQLWKWIQNGEALRHLFVTLQETVAGFVIGGLLGVGLGLALGLTPFMAKVLDPIVIGFYSLPKIALAPLFLVWFGIGITMKIALSAISVLFLVLFNTLAGVRDVDDELIDVIRLMKGGRYQILREVVIPSALVWVFSGLRVSVPYALIGAVTGEIITSNRGLGYLVARSAGELDTTGVFAALCILVLVSVTLYQIVVKVERRLLHWRGTGRPR